MQFNVRLPKALVEDMEFIANNIKISRNDWLKVKLAELISREIQKTKHNLIITAGDKFVRGVITDKDFKRIRGSKPNKAMEIRRNEYQEQEKKTTKNSKASLKKYLRDIAKKAEK